MADTIRPDHLGVYGYGRDTTPTLARLAIGGTRFDDTMAQATWTKVSTPSILTSLYPLSHTVTDVPDRLPSSATTLAEIYRAAGHATLSFSSVTFSGAATNPAPGIRGAARGGIAHRGQPRQVGAGVRRPTAAVARSASRRGRSSCFCTSSTRIARSSRVPPTTPFGPTRPGGPRTMLGSRRFADRSTVRFCVDK